MSFPSDHQPVLDTLIALGEDLARQVHAAAGKDLSLDDATVAFDRIARAVRRTVALSRRLAEAPARDRTVAARREIIRRVEDAIILAPQGNKPALHAEFHERLDAPELDDEIGDRPATAVITDILRDLGLASPQGQAPWPRRTPAEIQRLHARARRLPIPADPADRTGLSPTGAEPLRRPVHDGTVTPAPSQCPAPEVRRTFRGALQG